MRFNHTFAPVRTLSIKQNPNTFSLPSCPFLKPQNPQQEKNITAFPSSMWQACLFLCRNVPSKPDTASLGKQGWNLSMTKAEVGSDQGHCDLGRAKSFISATAESQNRNSKVSHAYPGGTGGRTRSPFAAQKTQQQYGHWVMVKHVALSNLYFLRGFYRMGCVSFYLF